MKKIYSINKIVKMFVLCVYLFLFNTACGLDTFYIIDAPEKIHYQPLYNNTDYSSKYFEFYTKSNNNIEGFIFLGTEVYYKIYDSSSRLQNERESLITISQDLEKNAGAAEKLINEYRYVPLKVTGSNESPLIPASDSDQLVYIRLTDYQNADSFASKIKIDNVLIGKPIRNMENKPYTFNFGRKGEYDVKPVSGDADTSISTSSKKYYVCLFAVGVGRDATFANYYSNILYLGDVTIDSESFDN